MSKNFPVSLTWNGQVYKVDFKLFKKETKAIWKIWYNKNKHLPAPVCFLPYNWIALKIYAKIMHVRRKTTILHWCKTCKADVKKVWARVSLHPLLVLIQVIEDSSLPDALENINALTSSCIAGFRDLRSNNKK